MRRKQVGAGMIGAALAILAFWSLMPTTGETVSRPVDQERPAVVVPVLAMPSTPSEAQLADPVREEAAADKPWEWTVARHMHGEDVALGMIEGHVAGDDGEPLAGAFVRAAAESGKVHAGKTDADGRYRFVLPVGRVMLSAARFDQVEVLGPEELVTVREDASPYVPLELLSGPAAGLGIFVMVHRDGFEVSASHGPARAAGLEPGMVVQKVGERDATDMTMEEMRRAMVGAVGSEVTMLVALGDGTAVDMTLERGPWD